MKRILLATMVLLGMISATLHAQKVELKGEHLQAVGVSMSLERMKGKKAVRVVKDTMVKEFDEPTFVKIKGIDFTSGTIEVKVLSRLLKSAPDYARGFIGVAFHINDSNSRFESIYLRPTNARADDQVRRNHSIQYFAYPEYKFQRLRKEAPERYEAYADMALDEWITMRIVVKGQQAKLYLNNSPQPSLVVNDLKLGSKAAGDIGLWVDVGTEGYFSGLKVRHE
ncbi:MAG TPA: hypothetical protein VGN63_09800 [Flavisolibacter sp.]|jgi:hypothetical protein|nr:hypothetical protein [Flavisolibacter sp.]